MAIDYIKELDNYQVQMTEGERMEKYMSGEEVDHLPYAYMGPEPVIANIMGYTTSDMENDFDLYCEIIERRIEKYKTHGISIGLGLRTIGYACGSKASYPVNGVDHVEEYRFPHGYELDVDALEMPDPYDNEVLTPMLEMAKKLRERFPDEPITTSATAPMSAATGLRPVEALLKDSRKNREEFDKLMDFCNEASFKWARTFIDEFGESAIGIADPVSCADILGPRQFEDLSYPYLKEMVDTFYEISGKKPTLHICGHTKAIWPYLKELDIAAFSVDNWEDIGECADFFGDACTVVGNVPPTDIMGIGTADEVVESVKTCIKKAADADNGYIINQGCGLMHTTPEENMAAFLYAVRKYGAKAKKGEVPEAVYQD